MYIRGDYNSDGSRYEPSQIDSTIGVWDNENHWLNMKPDYFEEKLGISFDITNPQESIVDSARDIILDYLYSNPYDNAYQIVEFKIARTKQGLKAFVRMMEAQVRYMLIDGADLDEYGSPIISKRALQIAHNDSNGRLGFKGRYMYRVNTDVTDDDGLYNDY